MAVNKTKKPHAQYEPDLKEEIVRMLNSDKNVDEISKHLTFINNEIIRRENFLVMLPERNLPIQLSRQYTKCEQ
jgi:transposase-like protein